MKTLFPFQATGAAYLLANDRALNGDEQGLGKSVQVVEAARLDRSIRRILMIVPASLIYNWRLEFQDHYPEFSGRLQIVSYNKAIDYSAELANEVWDLLVCDEAHFLKNPYADRTIAALRCSRSAHRYWNLTGTPMPNNPSELWTLIRYTRPDLIQKDNGTTKSYLRFREEFCEMAMGDYGEKVVGGKNLDRLAGIMQHCMIRRTKAEVLPELPPLFVTRTYVEASIPRELRALEKEFGPRLRSALEAMQRGDMTALEEIAPQMSVMRRLISLVKAPAIARQTLDRLEGNERDPLILFAHHTDAIDSMAAALRKGGASVVTLVGSHTPKQRQAAVDAFQNGRADVFIGSIRAAGAGITLTRSSHLTFAEEDWTPGNNAQAMMRPHRIGQTRAVNVAFASLANSIDDLVQDVVARKAADIAAVLSPDRVRAA